MVIVIVIAVLAAAAAAFALTRGGSSTGTKATATTGPESTTTTLAQRTPDQIEADRASAQAVVLQTADMPPDWSGTPSPDRSGNAPSEIGADAEFSSCIGDNLPAHGPDGPVGVKGDVFADGPNRAINGEVDVYVNPRAAKDDFDILKNRKLEPCLGQFIDASLAKELDVTQLPAGVKFGTAVVTDWSIGNVHSDVIGIRALVGIQSGQASGRVALDLVFALKGRTLMTFEFLTNADAITADFELELTNKVVDRAPKD